MDLHFIRRFSTQTTPWRPQVSMLSVGLALHLLFASSLCGQVVRGTILDSEFSRPVRDVAVLVDGSASAQRTDSTGSFRLDNLERGKLGALEGW